MGNVPEKDGGDESGRKEDCKRSSEGDRSESGDERESGPFLQKRKQTTRERLLSEDGRKKTRFFHSLEE